MAGAGKTSFMNAISGRAYYAKRTGTMLVNDRNIDIPELGGHVGFVPQDDVVHDFVSLPPPKISRFCARVDEGGAGIKRKRSAVEVGLDSSLPRVGHSV